MSFTPSPFVLWGKMTLGLLAAAALFGPSIAAFASSPPVVPVPSKVWVPVIRAHPFLNLAAGSGIGDPPLHIGPAQSTRGLFYEEALRQRMIETASRCLDSSGYLTLSASVDPRGNIRDVDAESGGDRAVAACATAAIRGDGAVETRGPGRMKIGFFMGRENR